MRNNTPVSYAFTCTITLESSENGTKYTAHVMHGDAEKICYMSITIDKL